MPHMHTPTYKHIQDELVEYHIKHDTFPEDEFKLPKRVLPDLVVLVWLLLLGVPVFLAGVYLAWVGAWFILLLIVLVVILGEVNLPESKAPTHPEGDKA